MAPGRILLLLIAVLVTQEELGLEATPRDVLLGAIPSIPFWPAMKLLARFQRDLWPVRTIADGQLELAGRFFSERSGFFTAAKAFLAGGERRALFSEQQIFTLQKLLLMYGGVSEVDQELDNNEYLGLVIALAAIPGTLLGPQASELQETEASGVIHQSTRRCGSLARSAK